MKIIYCHADVYNPGGMERVLLNKLRGWVERGYDTMVVTTDQHGRPPFYEFPPEVRMVDLGINYKDDNNKNPIAKTLGYLRRRRKHRKALTELLMRERPDIVVSLFPSESSFIPDIHDGSLKMLELHFNKQFRLQYNRKGLLGLADRIRTKQDETPVESISATELKRRFDANEPVQVIDLREPHERAYFKFPNAKVIPLGQVVRRMDELDPAIDAVFVCKIGQRSILAIRNLRDAGYTGKAMNLLDGVQGWINEVDPTAKQI